MSSHEEYVKLTSRTCIFRQMEASHAFLEWVVYVNQIHHGQRGVVRVCAYFIGDKQLKLRGPEWLSELDILKMCPGDTGGILNVVRTYDSSREVVLLGLVYSKDESSDEMLCHREASFVESIRFNDSSSSSSSVHTPPPASSPCTPQSPATPGRTHSPAIVEVSS